MKKPRTNTKQNTNELLNSLKNLSDITKNHGKIIETHVMLKDKWVMAYNGIIAAAEPIEEEITACPNNELLMTALSKCGQNISISMLENNRLSIKSDKFKAIVKCLNLDDMQIVSSPDDPIALLDDRLRTSISAVSVIPETGIDNIISASILINDGSVIASDRHVIIEHWHGLNLPPNIVLPKIVISPLLKNPKKLIQFGFSPTTFTFFFENNGWLKTGLFTQQWPSKISKILDVKCNSWPVPEEFFKAVDAIAPFSETGDLYFISGKLCSHNSLDVGAVYDVYGLPNGPIYSAKQLKLIQPYVKTIDFIAPGPHNSNMLIFHGENVRGAIAGKKT